MSEIYKEQLNQNRAFSGKVDPVGRKNGKFTQAKNTTKQEDGRSIAKDQTRAFPTKVEWPETLYLFVLENFFDEIVTARHSVMPDFMSSIHDLKNFLVSKLWIPATGAGMTGVDADMLPSKSKRLLGNSGRETGSHFRWNCSRNRSAPPYSARKNRTGSRIGQFQV